VRREAADEEDRGRTRRRLRAGSAQRLAIEEDRYAVVIDENRAEAESLGINAIPAHIFARRFLVVGAQPDEVFDQVLGKVAEVESAEEGSPG